MENNNKSPKFDLHVHTTASDGSHNAQGIIRLARNNGFKAIAITDHDTTDNLKPCIAEGEKYGIKVIPGIELSAEVPEGKMHILGLGIDPNDEEFCALAKEVSEGRKARNLKIVETLRNTYKLKITIEDVEKHALGSSVGKPHIAAALIAHGYATNVQNAFDKYLAKADLDSIDRMKLTPKECIMNIHKAGGIAILAHPNSLTKKENKEKKEETLEERMNKYATARKWLVELKAYGLDGIEVYHNSTDTIDRETYKKMADEFGLYVSCGSDFHGYPVKNDVHLGVGKKANPIPSYDESILNGILEAIEKHKSHEN